MQIHSYVHMNLSILAPQRSGGQVCVLGAGIVKAGACVGLDDATYPVLSH